MHKPLFGPCDSFQLEPFVYEWAWKMARDQEENNWAPEEIQVGPDVQDYRDAELPENFRHILISVMAQLTTFDIERGDDAAETFLQILQPAELKHFMKRLVWDEALHTRSYRFCIENMGIPVVGPDNIYDMWKRVPCMQNRVEMAQEISDGLIGYFYGERRRVDGGEMTLETLEAKSLFFRAAFFWFLIFEGLWFWVNLSGPIQALSRLGRFQKTAEQFQYILRDEVAHIRFGLELCKEVVRQYPEVVNDDNIALIHRDVHKAILLEEEFIHYVLSQGQPVGYSANDHVETAKYIANMRLRSVGFPNLYEGVEHRFPWFSEALELRKEKNFFETRVTEYRTAGALSFDDDEPDDNEGPWANTVGI
jgi:ribonucleoside-diphosphate reductase beta chain